MTKIAADRILGPHGKILSEHTLTFSGDYITEIKGGIEPDAHKIEGLLIPGLVNAHCHLELSYMKGKIPKGTGLNRFLDMVEKVRGEDSEQQPAMQAALQQLINSGVVAVGDISNSAASYKIKNESPLNFHTFLEIYAFDPQKAEKVFNKGMSLLNEFEPFKSSRNTISLSPHAPYSCSPELLKLIIREAQENRGILSIHNQESEAENQMFQKGEGPILDRLKSWGINTDHFLPTGKSSLSSLISYFTRVRSMIFVHNTFSSPDDIQEALEKIENPWFCFCPRANLYIENSLPEISSFPSGKIILGTDSLASNDDLDLFKEIKTIRQHFPGIKSEEVLTWATSNGAQALGLKELGTLEIGKRPGLCRITGLNQDGEINSDSICEPIYLHEN